MTKEIAKFSTASLEAVLATLNSFGWKFRNPATSTITGWTNQGDEKILASEAEAIESLALAVGHGVQLWTTPFNDLFLSCGKDIQIYFSGFTADESAILMAALRDAGLHFEVDADY